MLESNDKYFEILNDIKRTLVVTRNKIVENANKELILMYYSIGSKLIMNNKWGSSFIDNLARDLKMEFPTIKGMSARNLRYMQKFASEYDNDEFLQGVLAELSLKDVNKPIGVSEYKILSEIPEYLESTLPSIEDIEKRLEANDIDEI